jgi:iron(III) transport system substrate-binding protein
MILAEGEDRTLDWLQGIAGNDPVIFDGNSPIVEAVDAGDVAAGLVNHYYLLQLANEQGGATAVNHSFASGDPGALVMSSGVGLLATADNREAGLEFIRFLLSAESQTYFLDDIFEYPLIEGAGTPADQVPLEDLPTLDIDPSELATVVDQATTLIAEAGLT